MGAVKQGQLGDRREGRADEAAYREDRSEGLTEASRVKSANESRIRLAQIMTDHDTNLYGTIHGGTIMKLIDDAAASTAARHAEAQAVTLAVDSMRFRAPVRVGDLVTVDSEVVAVGRSSMTIEVTVQAAQAYQTALPRQCAAARLTFVAIDDQEQPVAVPRLGE